MSSIKDADKWAWNDADVIARHLDAKPGSLFEQFGDGRMLIHIAAEKRVGEETARLLLAKNKDAAYDANNKRSRLPLHFALAFKAPEGTARLILEANPDGAGKMDGEGNLALHLALKHKSSEATVQLVLEAHPKAASEECDGQLPLHLALKHKSSEATVQLVFEAHPKAASEKCDGQLPLHLALEHKSSEATVQLVLKAHPKAASEKCDGQLPLHLALKHKSSEATVQLVFEAHPKAASEECDGKKDGEGAMLPLHIAVSNQATEETVKLLLTANPKAAKNKGRTGKRFYPLHIASDNKAAVATLRLLLEAYPKAASEECGGLLPLHIALRKQATEETVQLLLKANPKAASAKDGDGLLPRHIALSNRATEETVQLLLQANPKAASAKDGDGLLPLHIALSNRATEETVQLLLQANPKAASARANPKAASAKDGEGAMLPLHIAVSNRATEETVQLLLKANPKAALEKRVDGKALIIVALERGSQTTARLLLEANPNAKNDVACEKDEHGHLPLHHAVVNQPQEATLRLLLDANPDAIRVKGRFGRLPLHLGLLNGIPEAAMRLLLEANPDAAQEKDRLGNLPLWLALEQNASEATLRLLLQTYPDAARVANKAGQTPLQFAIGREASDTIVRPLLEVCPQAAGEKIGGKMPLELALTANRNEATVQLLCAAYIPAAIAQKQWEFVDIRTLRPHLLAHPEKARERDGDGNLFLHLAVANQAPDPTTQLLFETYSDAARVKDKKGNLPLHIALANEASEATVRLLLDAHPDAAREKDKKGNLPLHIALANKASEATVRLLLDAHPDAAREKDKKGNGNLPLHIALANKALDATVQLVLRIHLEAASEPNMDSKLPLELALEKTASDTCVRMLLEVHPEAVRKSRLGRLPLHVALANKASAATVRQLITAHVDAVSEKDKHGCLPLHLSLQHNASYETICVVLEAHSEAAREKNEDDKFPLQLALETKTPEVTLRLLCEAYLPAAIEFEQWNYLTVANARSSMGRDQNGKLPLELAVEKAAPVSILKTITDAMPERLDTKTTTGATFHFKLLGDDREEVRDFAAKYGAFLGKYKLVGEHVHNSHTCLVIFAEELESEKPVALKLMHNEEEWLREQRMRKLSDDAESCIDAEHVVPLLTAQALEMSDVESDSRLKGAQSYGFLLVMPRAKRDLCDALAHYRFAGRDHKQVVEILTHVARHLQYLNERCLRVHGDLKPRNLIQLETEKLDMNGLVIGSELTWSLIDLDASCTIGDAAGQKVTSSAFFPPEMARYWLERDVQEPPKASVGFELWYFGCLLYQLCTMDGETLWHMNQADNIDDQQMRVLAYQWPMVKAEKLAKIVWPQAAHLAQRLLDNNPQARPTSWDQILKHPFLAANGPAEYKTIVMSCPEMGTLDEDGGVARIAAGATPHEVYNQRVMDKVSEFQQLGFVKFGFDRAGTSTARETDGALFDTAFSLRADGKLVEAKELLRSTDWWYGYQTSVKQAAKLESQGFDGVLEIMCIRGGFITQLEAEEMERIMSEAKSDAIKSGIVCRYTVSEVSYCEVLKRYELGWITQPGGAGEPAPAPAPALASGLDTSTDLAPAEGEIRCNETSSDACKDEVIAQLRAALDAKDEELKSKDQQVEKLLASLNGPQEGTPPTVA